MMAGDKPLLDNQDEQWPTPPEWMIEAIGNHPDFRVLRRLTSLAPVARLASRPERCWVGCAVDVETTGLDHRTDKIVELAAQRFRFDEHGRIFEVGQPRSWLEDPGVALTPSVSQLTGLVDADLALRWIDDVEATGLLASADVIVAHNAGFDRPFVDARLPGVRGKAWACSMRDVGWRTIGFEGSGLGHLLLQCGTFYEAHRAEVDVNALLTLLAHEGGDGVTVLRNLVGAAEQPSWRIEAIGAPFSTKDSLKARGYCWIAEQRFWRIDVRDEKLPEETDWLATRVYQGIGEPRLREITWHERYAEERS